MGIRNCTPIERYAYGNTPNSAICNGTEYTLITANVKAVENVIADLYNGNYGETACPVTFTFYEHSRVVLQQQVNPGETITIQVPGKITRITATCGNTGTASCYANASVSFIECVCC